MQIKIFGYQIFDTEKEVNFNELRTETKQQEDPYTMTQAFWDFTWDFLTKWIPSIFIFMFVSFIIGFINRKFVSTEWWEWEEE